MELVVGTQNVTLNFSASKTTERTVTQSIVPPEHAETAIVFLTGFEVNYTSAVAAVQDGLTTLASAVQTVEVGCQVPLGAFVAVPPPETRSPACRSFLASRPGAPLAALRVVCESSLSAEECSACLGRP